jgi:hypothetical protein
MRLLRLLTLKRSTGEGHGPKSSCLWYGVSTAQDCPDDLRAEAAQHQFISKCQFLFSSMIALVHEGAAPHEVIFML